MELREIPSVYFYSDEITEARVCDIDFQFEDLKVDIENFRDDILLHAPSQIEYCTVNDRCYLNWVFRDYRQWLLRVKGHTLSLSREQIEELKKLLEDSTPEVWIREGF